MRGSLYRVLGSIGSGGMGDLLVENREFGGREAMKVFSGADRIIAVERRPGGAAEREFGTGDRNRRSFRRGL